MRDQQKICREEWFKEHKAERLTGNLYGPMSSPRGEVIIIEWKKPTSWNYGCRFIIHSQWLTVVGDIGEAVYQWRQNIDLPFLAGLDLHYFWGKCQSSETGRRFQTWCSVTAYRKGSQMIDWLSEDKKQRFQGWDEQTPHDEFEQMLNGAYNDDGIDSETASDLHGCGYIIHPRCVGHFVGLKMAIEQLTKPT